MAKEIFMPKLSSTMQVGTLLQWFKEEGDTVEVGEPLFEIMTDKINIEVEAYEEGTLLKRYYGEDDEVPVNYVVGFIGEPSEEVPEEPPGDADADGENKNEEMKEIDEEAIAVKPNKEGIETGKKVRSTPAARHLASKNGLELAEIEGSGPNGRVQVADVEVVLQSAPKATPLAKKVAKDQSIDLSNVEGSGPNGKIYRSDLSRDEQSELQATSSAKRVKLEGISKVVAQRMQESASTVPHVTINTEIDMSEVIAMRKSLLPIIEKQTGHRVSFTEIIIKAVAHTLQKYPIINASLVGNEIVYHHVINIGLAVAIDNGLVVPVIKNADQKGLAELTTNSKTLTKEARDGQLKPDAMSNGTFTISNLGMYAVDSFNPIINQPESAILGVGRITEKPVGIDGEIVLRPIMGLSLSFDHRIINGAPAAAFITDLKSMLEQPFELLV
ncbi:dihydrolipoamide acetyltransferase family protein [Gracilibacillus suaedae]|uniref:dihydrolipoamide acetyltransferase family protein n=1 Tax=Gracilibacillus suaedae TaxID=2820273 RepID=UPI001ABEC583|nr:dihydrolipoamide acetyltransferase family protein [Gracilibacillus suaedae]